MTKDGRYYEPGEPKGKPYFFYLVIPPPWNNGGHDDIYSSLIDPKYLTKTQFQKIKDMFFSGRKSTKDFSEGRFDVFKRVFRKFDQIYNIDWFSSLEDGTWLDFQAINIETANKTIEEMFREVEAEIGDFPITPKILPYNEHHRRGLLIETRYTNTYTAPPEEYHEIFARPFNLEI